MYKNNKELLKLVSLIIFILIIPLIFISMEAINKMQIVSEINPNEIITNTLDDLYKNISSKPKNNDSSTIRRCLTEIFELMNEKNYTKLYSLLTDDIKDIMFNTEEDFASYMDDYLKTEKYSPEFLKYEKLNKEENDVFIVKTNFIPYSTAEKDILSEKVPSISDTFTIYLNDDSSYRFSFLSYIGTGKSNHTFTNKSITCKINSTDLYTNKTIFTIEITNKIDTDIFIEKEGIYVKTGLMPKYYNSSVLIPANTTVTVQYTIYTGLDLKNSLPIEIYFKGVHINGNVCLFYLPIKYPVKISSVYNI